MTLDDWHAITHLACFHVVLAHLTWYYDTWLDTIAPDNCITLHIHDYHFYGDLAWLLYYYQTSGTPELLCSYIPVFLNPCNKETPEIMLLILCSCWSLQLDNHGCWITVYSLWALSLDYIYNKVLNLHLGGRNWWIPVWCHIYNGVISEVSCGARNDRSSEAVACTPEPSPKQRQDSL